MPTSSTTVKSPSTCTTGHYRTCWPPGWSSKKCASGCPIPLSTLSTLRFRKPPRGCVAPSPSFTRRCSPNSASRLRCENWYGSPNQRGDFEVHAEIEDVGKPSSQSLLYRAARELLTNIHKHARASVVSLRLHRKGDRIVLTVVDDGAGFDPAVLDRSVADGHIGLGSVLVRVESMGGSFELSSQVGQGTQVTVTSPPDPSTPAR